MSERSIHDDYRSEITTRFAASRIYNQLRALCASDPAGNEIMAVVNDAAYYAYQRTKIVVIAMREYTLHDGDHLFRVLNLMERLIPDTTLKSLSIPELMLLVLCAFFHDIGMAPSQRHVSLWRRYWDEPRGVITPEDEQEFGNFEVFARARPSLLETIRRLHAAGQQSQAELLKDYLIAEHIRCTHADRARSIIESDWNGRIRYRDNDFTVEFAQLCFSHNDDPLSLLDFEPSVICAPSVNLSLPFVGVVLRLADILDFDAKRTPAVLFAHLGVRHPVSIREWQKHRQISAWTISPDAIAFRAVCEHPAIEDAVRQFCDLIDRELTGCSAVLQHRFSRDSHYHIPLPPRIDRSQIGPKKDIRGRPTYTYRPTRFHLSQRQVVELLMGTGLYGDPAVALRELIQNSVDACLARAALEQAWGNKYDPSITVAFDTRPDGLFLRVEDNGIGMDQDTVDNYYANVGASFYRSAEFYELKAKFNLRFEPISRFGIGALSCFMVSDSVLVDTRRVYGPHYSSDPLQIRIDGLDSIFWITAGARQAPGTAVELSLRTGNPWSAMTTNARIASVKRIVQNPPFAIRIVDGTVEHVHSTFLRETTRDVYWPEDDVRIFEVSLDDEAIGLAGFARLAVLIDEDGLPTKSITTFERRVNVDGEGYTLSTRLTTRPNTIDRRNDTLALDSDDDKVRVDSTYSEHLVSHGELSSHGIGVPARIFVPVWERPRTPAHIVMPCPVLLKVDVRGMRDVDLNAARTEIVANEKWFSLLSALSSTICKRVRAEVQPEFWDALVAVWTETLTGESQSESARRFLDAIHGASATAANGCAATRSRN